MSYIHCALFQCSNFFCLFTTKKKLLLTFYNIKSNLGRVVCLCFLVNLKLKKKKAYTRPYSTIYHSLCRYNCQFTFRIFQKERRTLCKPFDGEHKQHCQSNQHITANRNLQRTYVVFLSC